MAYDAIASLFISLGLKSTVEEDVRGAEKAVSSLSDTVVQQSKLIGGAMTGAGLAIVALTDSSKKTNAALGVTGLQLGLTADEMRALALSTTNVTFPLEEVTATFDLLARAGMRNQDELAATANAFDTLGDAIGMSASDVTTSLIPAFNAFGIPLQDAAEHTDTLTHLFRTTTLEMSDFSSTMNYLAADIEQLGIGIDDTAGILEAMAAKGIQGSAATREFRKAVGAADGDVGKLYEALGLTADEVGRYRAEIEGAEGMTQAFADAANRQYGMVDKLKQGWSEWTLRIGSALEPLDAVGAVMATVGPIMMGIGPAMQMVAAIKTSTFIPALYASAAAGWAAVAPWLPFIVAAGLVIAALYLLETRFGVLTAAVNWLTAAGQAAVAWMKGSFVGAMEDGSDILLLLLGPIGWVIAAFRRWDEIPEIVSGAFGRVRGYLDGLIAWFGDAGRNITAALVKGILSAPVTPYSAIASLLGPVSRLLPSSPAKEGPLSKPPNWSAYLVDPLMATAGQMRQAASTAVAPVAAAPAAASPSSQSVDNSMHIGKIEFSNRDDIDHFWRRRDEQIRQTRIQRGIRL